MAGVAAEFMLIDGGMRICTPWLGGTITGGIAGDIA